jgi:hypothetical protein
MGVAAWDSLLRRKRDQCFGGNLERDDGGRSRRNPDNSMRNTTARSATAAQLLFKLCGAVHMHKAVRT